MTLLTLAAAFLLGVFLASRFDLPLVVVGVAALVPALLIPLLAALRRSLLPAVIAVALVLGLFRVEGFESDEPPDLVAHHSRLPVEIEGVIVSDPEPAGAFTRFRMRAERIRPDDEWIEVSDDTQVTVRESTELVRLRDKPYFRYGDRLSLVGPLEQPPVIEDFDYPAYLARQGITTVVSFPSVTLLEEGQGNSFYQWLYSVRQRLASSLTRVVPEPQASLGQALLLGIKDGLPDSVVDEFQRTGTSHVLAISGLHIGIMLGMTLWLSRRILGRRHQTYLVLSFVLMWFYALISGASPSVIRAAIMGTVYLFALALGRPRSTLPALGLAATIMVAVSPNVLQSVSFQLSFAAMAGIAVLAEPLSQRTRAFSANGSPILIWLLDTTAMTVAATIATLPIVAFYFERVSLIGMPATALVLPAMPFVIVAQAVAGAVGLFSPVMAMPFAWIAWAASVYVTGVIDVMARIPGASVETGNVAPLLVWVYYAVLVGLFIAGTRIRLFRDWLGGGGNALSTRASHGRLSWGIVVPVIALAALVWVAAQVQSDHRLHVVFVDVGQGDAIFIETPSGKQVLVDGGPDSTGIIEFLGERMPVTDRSIDLMVLSHAHADHVSGLVEVLNRYDVERILERRIDYNSPAYEAWHRAVSVEDAIVLQAQSGQKIDFGDDVIIEVVNPPEKLLRGTKSDADNASVALRVVYDEVSFLLTGDMYSEAERALLRSGVYIDSDVLKVGHHGSRSSSTERFIDEVSPTIAVIQAGEDNRFNHPHHEVVETLRRHVKNEFLFMTRENGTIEVITDGERLEIKTER